MSNPLPAASGVRRWLWILLGLITCVRAQATLEDEIRAFEASDALNPPPLEAILFTGSSSIRVWSTLTTAFTNHTVLNRGFGGSQMSDLLFYFDRVVVPYQPSLVVAYEGDNDLAAGESVDAIFGEYTNFLARMERQLPGTDVALMAVKPSPSRAQYLASMQELNSRLQALADGRHIRFIDVYTPLLTSTGQTRPELYQSDLLHLNAAGYAIWEAVVGPVLDAWALGRGQTFLLDFGASTTPTTHAAAPGDPVNYWNNVSDVGQSATGRLTNLVAAGNLRTEIGLAIVQRFNGVNENGTTNATRYPLNAVRDSLFGNTETFNGLSNVYPSFKLTRLDPTLTYNFTFFASRTGASDNRECGYTLTGGNTGFAALNAANNISNTVSVPGMTPDTNAEITISLAPTSNNTSPNHFTYLGVLQMEAVPPQTPIVFTRHPTNLSVVAPKPVTFSAAVAGARPYAIQWWSNDVAIPGANRLTYTIAATSLAMDQTTYSVSVSNLAYGAQSAGAILTVLADTNPPVLLSATALTGATIDLTFSEALGPSAELAANYTINSQPVANALLVSNGIVVRLSVASPLTGSFTVIVNNVQDLAGNTIAPGSSVQGVVPVPQADVFLIDFGSSSTTEHGPAPDDPTNYWNNVTETVGTTANGVLSGLVTTRNTASSVSLVMLRRFNGANLNGTTAASLFPADATRDSLYGNTEAFNSLANVFPSFKLVGLNPTLTYDLVLYASRTGTSDIRETGYTVVGASTNLVALDAANNINNAATLRRISPNAAGEITVSLAPSARNNNANHFTYLGVLKLSAIVPLRFQPPTLTGGQLRLDWTGTGQLESAPTVNGPWSSIGSPTPPYLVPVVSGEARFFRLRP